MTINLHAHFLIKNKKNLKTDTDKYLHLLFLREPRSAALQKIIDERTTSVKHKKATWFNQGCLCESNNKINTNSAEWRFFWDWQNVLSWKFKTKIRKIKIQLAWPIYSIFYNSIVISSNNGDKSNVSFIRPFELGRLLVPLYDITFGVFLFFWRNTAYLYP